MHLKKLFVSIRLCVAIPAVLSGSAQTQSNLFSAEAKQKAEALLKQMNLDEKVGQLNQPSGLAIPPLGEKQDEFIAQGKVGSILWQMNIKEINRLQHIAVERSRLHIPILFGFDVIDCPAQPQISSSKFNRIMTLF